MNLWPSHVMGLDNVSGMWYAFWSGFGGRFAFSLAPVLVLLRKFNCEMPRCHRIGRHKTAAGHNLCRKHHPDDHLTQATVDEMHRVAQDRDR